MRVVEQFERAPVLGADTVVVIDGEILGKPSDPEAAEIMLARLSGHTHEVLTAVTMANEKLRTRLSRSLVTLRSLSRSERKAYCATGEPLDKAGAYAIQGRGALLVDRVEGSYLNVVGLPVVALDTLCRRLGWPLHRLADVDGRVDAGVPAEAEAGIGA